MTFILFLALLLAAGGSGWIVIRRSVGDPGAIGVRLGRYGLAAGVAQSVGDAVATVGRQRSQQSAVSRVMDRAVEGRATGRKIAARLEQADLKWTPGEFVVATIAVMFVGMFIGLLIKGTLGLLVLGFLGVVVPWMYLSRRASKRRTKFLEQLPDMAQMMGNSMRAGFSIIQSMELVAAEGPPPIREEFERVTTEVKLGLPLEQALAHLEQRLPSEDLALAITAINVQRQVGGNLAEILMVIARTVRERVRFSRDLRALTAQARYSSWIITALPVAVAIVINFLDRQYESYLYRDPVGHVMVGGAVLMIGLGYFFLSRIANIEV
ncbi:MAG TPA: type II secretion system F family protein [Chloroflexota bacterium]|nr:type II secretion system F family protein [Chloroflexota bacterium]